MDLSYIINYPHFSMVLGPVSWFVAPELVAQRHRSTVFCLCYGLTNVMIALTNFATVPLYQVCFLMLKNLVRINKIHCRLLEHIHCYRYSSCHHLYVWYFYIIISQKHSKRKHMKLYQRWYHIEQELYQWQNHDDYS